MVKAGKYTIADQGFAASPERLGGLLREALVMELPGGIPDEALAALCAGPIEVLDEEGNVVQTHAGPFRVVSHCLRLVRSDANSDVAALRARVTSLETELSEAKSAKESALDNLASLNKRFEEFKEKVSAAAEGGGSALGDLVGKLTGSGGSGAAPDTGKAEAQNGEGGV